MRLWKFALPKLSSQWYRKWAKAKLQTKRRQTSCSRMTLTMPPYAIWSTFRSSISWMVWNSCLTRNWKSIWKIFAPSTASASFRSAWLPDMMQAGSNEATTTSFRTPSTCYWQRSGHKPFHWLKFSAIRITFYVVQLEIATVTFMNSILIGQWIAVWTKDRTTFPRISTNTLVLFYKPNCEVLPITIYTC